jgi:DNA-binding protein HU-beta
MAQQSKVKVTKSTIISKKILTERIQLKLVSKKHSLTKSQVESVLTEYLEETKKALIKGEEIRLPGYFSFKTTITKPRVAMNLQTKQKMTIPAKRVPKIKFSADLKENIAKKNK